MNSAVSTPWFKLDANASFVKKGVSFDIAIFSDLSGEATDHRSLHDREFVEVSSPERLDALIGSIRPRVTIEFTAFNPSDSKRESIPVEIQFDCYDDFSPEGVLKKLASQMTAVKLLLEIRTVFIDLLDCINSSPQIDDQFFQSISSASELHSVLCSLGITVADELLPCVRKFIDETCENGIDELAFGIATRVREADEHLKNVLQQAFSAPAFRSLESRYRSLQRLVESAAKEKKLAIELERETGHIGIYVLNISAQEIENDLNVYSIKQSSLFQKLFSERFDMAIANENLELPNNSPIFPFSLIILDFDFTHKQSTTDCLSVLAVDKLAQIGQQCFCMVLLSLEPEFFGAIGLTALTDLHQFEDIFDSPEYLTWKQFRKSEQSRMVGVVSPRLVVRQPISEYRLRDTGLLFDEFENASQSSPLWRGGAFGVADCLIRSFLFTEWFSAAAGMDRFYSNVPNSSAAVFELGYGVIDPLPGGGDDLSHQSSALQFCYSESDEAKLAALGIIGLMGARGTNQAVVLNYQSMQEVVSDTKRVTDGSIRLSAMFNYMLSACCMAHRLKIECKQRIGANTSPEQLENELQVWLNQFSSYKNASFSEKIQKPLFAEESQIVIKEDFLDPGKLQCTISLCPHHKFDSAKSELELQPITLAMDIRSD